MANPPTPADKGLAGIFDRIVGSAVEVLAAEVERNAVKWTKRKLKQIAAREHQDREEESRPAGEVIDVIPTSSSSSTRTSSRPKP